MKSSIKFVALFFIAILTTLHAQQSVPTPSSSPNKELKLPSIDLFGLMPDTKFSHCGWGFGFNVLSKPINLGYAENKNHLQVRFGGGFYFADLYRSKVSHVPLVTPQTGDASVSLYNDVYGLNAITRFSLPYSNKIIPYVDVFGGVRGFAANMNITPTHLDNNYQKSSSQTISSFSSLNYGATGGVMISLGDYVKFNAAVMISYSPKAGEVANTDKVIFDGTNITYDKMLVPQKCILYTCGFTFLVDWKSSGTSTSHSGRSSTWGGSSGGSRSSHINIGTRPSR